MVVKVLILGGGGREHALAIKLAESQEIHEIIVAPGNEGMALTKKVSIYPLSLGCMDEILACADEVQGELIIIGPEAPLVSGVVNRLEEAGHIVFGPCQKAARLEGSKIFSKLFMEQFNIPTAAFVPYDSYDEALLGLKKWDVSKGIVLKADTLAAGKGVVVTTSEKEAEKTIENFMNNPRFPVTCKRLLIEEQVKGVEISAFAICDGEGFLTFGFARDYKRLEDGGQGPNTGGMGGYSMDNWPSLELRKKIEKEVFSKTIAGMKERGMPFKGVLFAGLMIDGERINVLEYNVRFGDPETQILLPLFDGNLFKVLKYAALGKLSQLGPDEIKIKNLASVHIVMATENYPGLDAERPMVFGNPISFPSQLVAAPFKSENQSGLFFSGVKKNDDGSLANGGGRVLGVTSVGKNLIEARENAYHKIADISFDNAKWRRDIARGK